MAKPKIVLDEVSVEVRGKWNGKKFSGTLTWNPDSGDPADWEQDSGPDDVDPTELLLLMPVKAGN